MSSEEFNALMALLRRMGESLGQQQAHSMRNSYILQEVVRDLAKTQPDPLRYVAGMFERVSARADQGDPKDEAHPVTAEFREATAQFFEQAGRPFRD